jgi:hypothetical protein
MRDPFSRLDVYHPGQRGKTTLKQIMNVFMPTLYADSVVRDGMQAGLAYLRLSDAALAGTESGNNALYQGAYAADSTREMFPHQTKDTITLTELQKYCSLDTLALYQLIHILQDMLTASS